MSPYCPTVLYVYELAVYCSYARHTLPIEYLVDRFVYPLDKWPVGPIVSREDRFKSVSSFQLVSGTAYCDRFSGECYSEVKDVALPSTNTPGCQLIQKPCSIDRFAEFPTDLAYSPKKESLRLVQ